VPGYFHLVPPGQDPLFRCKIFLKLALMEHSGTLGEYKRLPRSEGAAESSDAEVIGVGSSRNHVLIQLASIRRASQPALMPSIVDIRGSIGVRLPRAAAHQVRTQEPVLLFVLPGQPHRRSRAQSRGCF
jgi:hypothetical protein